MATADRTFTFTVTAPPSTTLGAAFAALTAGQSAQFAGGALNFGPGNMSFAHWSMLFHYDPIRKELQTLGKDAHTGGTGTIEHAIYNEAGGAWRSVRIWGVGSTGHVYSAHTLDPATGDHYYIQGGNQSAQRYQRSTDSWISDTSTAAGNWGTAPNNNTAWHPNLFGPGDGGLVSLTRQLSVRVYFWRKSTGLWSSLSASSFITVGTIEGGAVYSPALDAVVTGAGSGTNNMIRVDSATSISGIAATPISACGDHFTRNPFSVHPVSGKPMLLEQVNGGNRVWVYESSSNSWVLQGYTHPFSAVPSTAGEHAFITCPVAEYGGIAGLNVINSADQCRMDLWKPAS